jgi:hypothetical protein
MPGHGHGSTLWVQDIATRKHVVLVEGSDEFKYRSIHSSTLPELTIGGGSDTNKAILEEIPDYRMLQSRRDVVVIDE